MRLLAILLLCTRIAVAAGPDFHGPCIANNEHGIFALHRKPPERGSGYSLRWYRKDGARAPMEIALEFVSPPALEHSREDHRLKDFDINATTPFSKPMMRICDEGLLSANSFRGFWLLPFSDLQSYADALAGTETP